MSPSPTLVAGRYRLIEPLGSGGMGRVWHAWDEILGRDVAVKEIIPPEELLDSERDELRRRTLREARAAARLNHPNVVRVYDVFETNDRPWIVMEYVQSRSLHDVLAAEGPLDPVRVATIGLAVLGALRAAHRAGVLHRDVKPSNVLLGPGGRVVLTDFGIATVEGDATVTRPGLVLGSPAYIAPERAHDGFAGPESDLWSLGATLYAAVEGRSPFERPTAIATLAALASEDVEPPRNAGPALRGALLGLLRKDPATRITAMEADRRLRQAVADTPPTRRFGWLFGSGRSRGGVPRQRAIPVSPAGPAGPGRPVSPAGPVVPGRPVSPAGPVLPPSPVSPAPGAGPVPAAESTLVVGPVPAAESTVAVATSSTEPVDRAVTDTPPAQTEAVPTSQPAHTPPDSTGEAPAAAAAPAAVEAAVPADADADAAAVEAAAPAAAEAAAPAAVEAAVPADADADAAAVEAAGPADADAAADAAAVEAAAPAAVDAAADADADAVPGVGEAASPGEDAPSTAPSTVLAAVPDGSPQDPPLARTAIEPVQPEPARGAARVPAASAAGIGPSANVKRRNTVIVAAFAVVMLVAIVFVITRPTGRGGPSGAATGGATASQTTSGTAVPSAGPTTGAGPTDGGSPAASATGQPAQQQPGAVPPGGRPALRAGWREHVDGTGFSVYVPANWRVSMDGTMVYFRGNGRVLGIDQRNDPQPDPVGDWRRQRDTRVRAGNFPGYSEVHIQLVPYWQKAADWEFTFVRSGVRQHVNNRGFIVSPVKAYGIWWQTTDADWAAAWPDLQYIFDSFRPATT